MQVEGLLWAFCAENLLILLYEEDTGMEGGLFTHHSLLVVRHSLLVTNLLVIFTVYSLFSTIYSLLFRVYSLFSTIYSLLLVYNLLVVNLLVVKPTSLSLSN